MTDAKLIRFAAVLTVLAGYAFVFRAGEARIGTAAADNVRIAEQLRDDERTMTSRTAVAADRARLRERLRSAELTSDRSALVARFLRDAAALAALRHTAITTITAAPATTTGGATGTVSNGTQTTATTLGTSSTAATIRGTSRLAATTSAAPRIAATTLAASQIAATAPAASRTGLDQPLPDVAFEDIPLDVTVEGRYADVLATVRALSAGRVLASVDVTSLVRKSSNSSDATVTASLRVVLQRIAPTNVTEPAGAHRTV